METEAKEGLVEFVESKLPLKSEKNGDIITFEDKSPRSHVSSPDVRTYLKRYIHSKDLRKKYRVLSEDGSLKFVKQKIEEEQNDEN
ncbi:MAG TPA: hypothetical protein VNE86_04065 [Nitrososphaerales archaeon]|nr:hypothetical protein [Nitrososphaerales archaeon]